MNTTPKYTRAEMATMAAAGTVKNGTVVYCTDLTCNFSFENGSWVPSASSRRVNTQTASYTLALTDQNQIVRTNVASANNCTVPPNASVAFEIGAKVIVMQSGAGQTAIVAGPGVTIRSTGGKLKLTGQYSVATLEKIATNEWFLSGDIAV